MISRILTGVLAFGLAGCHAKRTAPLDYAAFLTETRLLFCDREVACGFYDAVFEARCMEQFRLGIGSVDAASAAMSVAYDSNRGLACLDAIDAALADCHYASFVGGLALRELMSSPPCAAVVQGLGPAGSACPNLVECAAGTYCLLHYSPTGSCSSVCQLRQPLGAPCGTIDKQCDATTFCDHGTQTCAAHLALGAPCHDEDACADGLSCEPSSGPTPAACRAKAGAGETCSRHASCQDSLECSPTSNRSVYACRAPGGTGAPCSANNGRADCARPLVCVSGACGPGLAAGERCGSSFECGERLFCVETASWSPPPMQTCQRPRGRGANCLADADCEAPHLCLNGTCTAPGSDGSSCIGPNDTMCLSGYCDWQGVTTNGTCMPRISSGASCVAGKGASPCEGNMLCDPDTNTCRQCR